MKAIQKLKSGLMPRKLSDLIDLGLGCLLSCNADPLYRVAPGIYHYAKDGLCYVDLRGAILAKHLGIPPSRNVGELSYFGIGHVELTALGYLCEGDVKECFETLGIKLNVSQMQAVNVGWNDDCVPDYDSADWVLNLRKFANDLKRVHL